MDILIPAERIQQRVAELGRQIAADYQGRPLTVVGVLTGCLIFLADLIRQMDLSLRVALIQASSYRGTATRPGELRVSPELLPDLRGRDVLLLDDILDTGQTLARLKDYLVQSGAASVRTVVLLRKLGRQTVTFEPEYHGFDILDVFVVGYGLDHDDHYRHLPYVAGLTDSDLKKP
jgi:hypoxanthine phosphoribosyltransferase